VELLYGTWGKRERKRVQYSVSNIRKHKICEGFILKTVENAGGGKGVRKSNGRG
jgi:hypothetical protein